MDRTVQFNLQTAVDQWSKQIKSLPSITEADSEEYKYCLLDMVDDFKSRGFDDEEAFFVASCRFKEIFNLQEVFEMVNMPNLQMKRITQVLSGVFIFFLAFFLMHSSSKLLFLAFSGQKDFSPDNMHYLSYLVSGFHLFIVFCAFGLYFFGQKIIKKFESFSIRPVHTHWLFLGIIFLAVVDHWLFGLIKSIYPRSGFVAQFYSIIDYSSYSFPLIFIVSFILMYKKYYLFGFKIEINKISLNDPVDIAPFDKNQLKNLMEYELSGLKRSGLNEEEALFIATKRKGLSQTQQKDQNETERPVKAAFRALLIVLSGILFYFFLYFFLQATARILITILEIIKDEPYFSIKWTWNYVIVFHLLFVFFTTSVFIRDNNVIQKLAQVKIEPKHAIRILYLTILFAFIDRCFVGISRYFIGDDRAMYFKMENISVFSSYCFPFVISACFLVLFNKYYRENMKI